MSAFLLTFKANYLKKMHAWLTQFFFVDSKSPLKDLFSPHGPNLTQKPLHLVGKVLNTSSISFKCLKRLTVHTGKSAAL